MKHKLIFVLALISIAAFFTGDWLMSIYGFDPPYIYFYGGGILTISSILTGLVVLGLIIKRFLFKK